MAGEKPMTGRMDLSGVDVEHFDPKRGDAAMPRGRHTFSRYHTAVRRLEAWCHRCLTNLPRQIELGEAELTQDLLQRMTLKELKDEVCRWHLAADLVERDLGSLDGVVESLRAKAASQETEEKRYTHYRRSATRQKPI